MFRFGRVAVWHSLAAELLVALCVSKAAHALQFEPVALSPTEVVLAGRGPIVAGDADRLVAALSAVTAGRTVIGLALDSGGGNLAEARTMVNIIRGRRLSVVIPPHTQCASACFLLLAASPKRLAANDALIGVHSASENGVETDVAMAETTKMARDAAKLGVPPSVIGKMVETTPGRVEWLAPQDLAAMRITIYTGDLLSALHQTRPDVAGADMARASPVVPSAQVGPPLSLSSGSADRQAWDIWMAGLRGAYRDGAVYAQTQINAGLLVSCYGPVNANRGDYTLGCLAAQQRYAALREKSRESPDYAKGWEAAGSNRAGLVAGSNIGGVANDTITQQYQGVLFCAARIGHLTVKVLQKSVGAGRRVLIVFGPHDGTDVPNGSFLAEGVFEVNGGLVTLRPVTWVAQPVGSFAWFGISGNSDDGGKTILGRVTDNATCTRFSLART